MTTTVWGRKPDCLVGADLLSQKAQIDDLPESPVIDLSVSYATVLTNSTIVGGQSVVYTGRERF